MQICVSLTNKPSLLTNSSDHDVFCLFPFQNLSKSLQKVKNTIEKPFNIYRDLPENQIRLLLFIFLFLFSFDTLNLCNWMEKCLIHFLFVRKQKKILLCLLLFSCFVFHSLSLMFFFFVCVKESVEAKGEATTIFCFFFLFKKCYFRKFIVPVLGCRFPKQ